MGGLQEVLLVLGVFRRGCPFGTRDSLSGDASGNRVWTQAQLPQPGVTQTIGGAGPIPEESQTSATLIFWFLDQDRLLSDIQPPSHAGLQCDRLKFGNVINVGPPLFNYTWLTLKGKKSHDGGFATWHHASLYSLWSFDQQLADEVDGELGHPGEGVPAVVHADLGHVQKRLLLVITSKGRLSCHQHVGDDPHTPEGTYMNRTISAILEPWSFTQNGVRLDQDGLTTGRSLLWSAHNSGSPELKRRKKNQITPLMRPFWVSNVSHLRNKCTIITPKGAGRRSSMSSRAGHYWYQLIFW